jgi:hypothetical protein
MYMEVCGQLRAMVALISWEKAVSFGGQEVYLGPFGNRTTMSGSRSPQPGHYTHWAVPPPNTTVVHFAQFQLVQTSISPLVLQLLGNLTGWFISCFCVVGVGLQQFTVFALPDCQQCDMRAIHYVWYNIYVKHQLQSCLSFHCIQPVCIYCCVDRSFVPFGALFQTPNLIYRQTNRIMCH